MFNISSLFFTSDFFFLYSYFNTSFAVGILHVQQKSALTPSFPPKVYILRNIYNSNISSGY